jgi:hypothetical protein
MKICFLITVFDSRSQETRRLILNASAITGSNWSSAAGDNDPVALFNFHMTPPIYENLSIILY